MSPCGLAARDAVWGAAGPEWGRRRSETRSERVEGGDEDEQQGKLKV